MNRKNFPPLFPLFLLFLILPFLFKNGIACAKDVSLDEKIGQMIIIGFLGDNIKDKNFKKVRSEIKKGNISGVIYFKRNISSRDNLIKMNQSLLKSSKTTPFIAIDNEGGLVQRFDFDENNDPYKSPSAKEVSKLNNDEARKEYQKMAKTLNSLGFNYNFAPCVDLDIEKESIISQKQRSYGSDYKTVSNYSRIFIEEMNKENIITSLKHFPGHGSTKSDTHKGFADSTDTFLKDEIMPYYDLSDLNKLNSVMVSHIFNSNFDKTYPASLSKETINDLIINSIGFKGVIISDDYDMRAIRDSYELETIVEKAIGAGVNILLFSNNLDFYDKNLVKKYKKIVKKGVKKGTINLQDIDNSYLKIMELKNNLKSNLKY